MIETRPASAADQAAVLALWQDCGLTRPWNDPAADFRRALDWPASEVIVTPVLGTIAASVMVGHDGHRGWVYYLAVARDHRRSGLGRALMAAAETWLVERGCPKIQLMVRDDNAAAIAFYRSLGLEVQKVAVLGRFLRPEPGRG